MASKTAIVALAVLGAAVGWTAFRSKESQPGLGNIPDIMTVQMFHQIAADAGILFNSPAE